MASGAAQAIVGALALTLAVAVGGGRASAAELRVMATGASKALVQMLGDLFQAQTGHRIILDTDTAGGVQRRIQAGEAADVVVATPVVIDALAMSGRLVRGSRLDLARTGIGIGIAEGAAVPDISSVEAVKRLIVNARGIAYVDPAGGGTSGIYFVRMVERLGLADVLRAKAKPKMGGYAAELVASGEADVVFHQISEIMPVSGVRLVGPLPAELQLVTTYSAGLAVQPREAEAARAFIALMNSPAAEQAIRAVHMEPAAGR
ncbi:MAG: substrate-binding domain-containing protein [Phreatobacter sp.]|uniref:molybdate ABC transporter substrate-binding protein n=1 Tax=Phreatobacter sp. TaxID=1966341 RepID=UPI001A50FE1D|nr:substrate-binding domain-containing protein [Phreatobacter sp.]MBL8569837.1 substrate-binding domain-containing protein [Phreatobacter sp.]